MEQYFTLSQFNFHFFRQTKDLLQIGLILDVNVFWTVKGLAQITAPAELTLKSASSLNKPAEPYTQTLPSVSSHKLAHLRSSDSFNFFRDYTLKGIFNF